MKPFDGVYDYRRYVRMIISVSRTLHLDPIGVIGQWLSSDFDEVIDTLNYLIDRENKVSEGKIVTEDDEVESKETLDEMKQNIDNMFVDGEDF